MPKYAADPLQATSLRQLLDARALPHLRVRPYGALLILESGPADDPVPHARFRRVGAHIWCLEMTTHTERWEPTPFRGQLEEMLDLLVSDFPWTLTPVV